MTERTTEKLHERISTGEAASTIARSALPLEKGGKTVLKAKKISRNHILADSRIRVILALAFGGVELVEGKQRTKTPERKKLNSGRN
jgi:hypothetical protein